MDEKGIAIAKKICYNRPIKIKIDIKIKPKPKKGRHKSEGFIT